MSERDPLFEEAAKLIAASGGLNVIAAPHEAGL
jgi:hypothetical protein